MAKGDMSGGGTASSSISPPKQDQYSVMHRIMDNFGNQGQNQHQNNPYAQYGPSHGGIPNISYPPSLPTNMNPPLGGQDGSGGIGTQPQINTGFNPSRMSGGQGMMGGPSNFGQILQALAQQQRF